MSVQLTKDEIYQAALCGVFRQVENIFDEDRPDVHGAKNNSTAWKRHIEGAMGELALCKEKGWYWGGKGKICGPDVAASNVEVRTTRHAFGSLILHKEDPPDKVFWLLTGQFGKYEVRGWILAKNGQQEKYWSDPQKSDRFAYFVPQSELTL